MNGKECEDLLKESPVSTRNDSSRNAATITAMMFSRMFSNNGRKYKWTKSVSVMSKMKKTKKNW